MLLIPEYRSEVFLHDSRLAVSQRAFRLGMKEGGPCGRNIPPQRIKTAAAVGEGDAAAVEIERKTCGFWWSANLGRPPARPPCLHVQRDLLFLGS